MTDTALYFNTVPTYKYEYEHNDGGVLGPRSELERRRSDRGAVAGGVAPVPGGRSLRVSIAKLGKN